MIRKKIKNVLVLLFCAITFISCAVKPRMSERKYKADEIQTYNDVFTAFDTECTITLYGSFDNTYAKESFSAIKEILSKYDKMFSKTDKESEIYNINHRDGDIVSTYDEVANLFTVAKEMYDWSSGYFDVSAGKLFSLWDVKNRTVLPKAQEIADVMPYNDNFEYEVDLDIDDENERSAEITFFSDKVSEYDFGALVKGYVCDEVKSVLYDHKKITGAILNLGGNVYCYGTNPNRENGEFRVGIYKPFSNGEIIETVSVNDKSVITSGNYQRYFKVEGDDRIYHHVINPLTGYPTDNGINSVTIISKNALLGDYLSTTCMILGEEYSKKLIDGCKREFNDDELYAIFVYSDMHTSKYPE